MQEQTKSAYEKVCNEMLNAFTGELTWQWDPRFEAVLAEFGQNATESIRAILDSHLNFVWDNSSLDQAPKVVQEIGNQLGGVMSNQLLFTSDPEQGEAIFCAWWPWGDGSTISIRLAPSYAAFSDEEKSQLIEQTKKLFNI